MKDRGDAAQGRADEHSKTAVRVLPGQVHDLYRHSRIFLGDGSTLAQRPPNDRPLRHGLVLSYKTVIFLAARRMRQGFKNKVKPAHLFMSPGLLFRRVLIRMI